jgi:hypothetical protein
MPLLNTGDPFLRGPDQWLRLLQAEELRHQRAAPARPPVRRGRRRAHPPRHSGRAASCDRTDRKQAGSGLAKAAPDQAVAGARRGPPSQARPYGTRATARTRPVRQQPSADDRPAARRGPA